MPPKCSCLQTAIRHRFSCSSPSSAGKTWLLLQLLLLPLLLPRLLAPRCQAGMQQLSPLLQLLLPLLQLLMQPFQAAKRL